MKKVATFFAMATVVVALSSCGSKTAESTEATDSTAVTEAPMEAAPMEAAPVDSAAMTTDTAAAH